MARILVIEDNPINLELMTYLLRAFGHEVLHAYTGAKGLEVLAETRVDLVACDIHMPGMDGYDVLRAIRARPEWAATRVIAVTASAMVGDREEVLTAGFDGYVSKPIDPQTFVPDLVAFIAPPRTGDGAG
jgi:two-component system, cell cycle response regulator